MAFLQSVADAKRLEQIVKGLVKYELGLVVSRLKFGRLLPLRERLKKNSLEKINPAPQKLRLLMEELGGGFIKLGQLLSLRPDLIPPEYCEEFRKMQDAVPPFPTDEAMKIIEHELKKPLHEVFSKFEKTPIASASIGQVYKGKLRSGKWVAIKVRRPNIETVFRTDIDLLKHLSELIEHHFHPTLFDPMQIVKEFGLYTRSELDYLVEARNLRNFYENFRGSKQIIIPYVYQEYCTSKVLVLQYLEGCNISVLRTLSDKKKQKIVAVVVNSIFKQVFEDGLFHADPHPGNILFTQDGKVGFLDFGIIGRIDDDLRDKMSDLFIAAILGDITGITNALVRLGVTPTDLDSAALKQDLYEHLAKYYGVDLKRVQIALVFNDILAISKKHHIRLPSNFVLLVKAIITVEGFARETNPKYNLVAEAKPYVKRLQRKKLSPRAFINNLKKSSMQFRQLFLRIPEQASEVMNRVKDADLSMRKIDKDIQVLTTEIDHSSNRVALGFLITAFIIAGASMISLDQRKIFEVPLFSFVAFCLAGALTILLLRSILREQL